MGIKLENDEVVVSEYEIFYGKELIEAKLTLTSKNVIIQQERGLIFKSLKVVEKTSYSDIKVYKNKARISQSGVNVVIETINGNVEFASCNVIESKKIIEKIITIMTDKNILTRTAETALKVVKGVAYGTGAVAAGLAAVVAIKNNKIQILDLLDKVFDKFNK